MTEKKSNEIKLLVSGNEYGADSETGERIVRVYFAPVDITLTQWKKIQSEMTEDLEITVTI